MLVTIEMKVSLGSSSGSLAPALRASALWGLVLLVIAPALAQVAAGEEQPPAEGLFDGHEPLPMVLEAPWKQILRKRADRPVETGRLLLEGSAARGSGVEARIEVRGRWRLENCSRPPLTLKLPAAEVAGSALAGQTVLHLTPQCRKGEKFRQHLVEEYLIFRAWALLTPTGLRTRLVSLEYREPGIRGEPRVGLAILVEDLGLAAERLGLEWSEAPTVAPTSLDAEAAALFALFQYLIGNTDWSMVKGPGSERCCHNAALMAPPGEGDGLLPVPYDFDASGLVDTGEISPSERLPIEDVRERLYRGFCVHNPEVTVAAARLRRARPQLEALITDSELLTPGTRRRVLKFLAGFFEVIDDPKKLASRVLEKCRE